MPETFEILDGTSDAKSLKTLTEHSDVRLVGALLDKRASLAYSQAFLYPPDKLDTSTGLDIPEPETALSDFMAGTLMSTVDGFDSVNLKHYMIGCVFALKSHDGDHATRMFQILKPFFAKKDETNLIEKTMFFRAALGLLLEQDSDLIEQFVETFQNLPLSKETSEKYLDCLGIIVELARERDLGFEIMEWVFAKIKDPILKEERKTLKVHHGVIDTALGYATREYSATADGQRLVAKALKEFAEMPITELSPYSFFEKILILGGKSNRASLDVFLETLERQLNDSDDELYVRKCSFPLKFARLIAKMAVGEIKNAKEEIVALGARKAFSPLLVPNLYSAAEAYQISRIFDEFLPDLKSTETVELLKALSKAYKSGPNPGVWECAVSAIFDSARTKDFRLFLNLLDRLVKKEIFNGEEHFIFTVLFRAEIFLAHEFFSSGRDAVGAFDSEGGELERINYHFRRILGSQFERKGKRRDDPDDDGSRAPDKDPDEPAGPDGNYALKSYKAYSAPFGRVYAMSYRIEGESADGDSDSTDETEKGTEAGAENGTDAGVSPDKEFSDFVKSLVREHVDDYLQTNVFPQEGDYVSQMVAIVGQREREGNPGLSAPVIKQKEFYPLYEINDLLCRAPGLSGKGETLAEAKLNLVLSAFAAESFYDLSSSSGCFKILDEVYKDFLNLPDKEKLARRFEHVLGFALFLIVGHRKDHLINFALERYPEISKRKYFVSRFLAQAYSDRLKSAMSVSMCVTPADVTLVKFRRLNDYMNSVTPCDEIFTVKQMLFRVLINQCTKLNRYDAADEILGLYETLKEDKSDYQNNLLQNALYLISFLVSAGKLDAAVRVMDEIVVLTAEFQKKQFQDATNQKSENYMSDKHLVLSARETCLGVIVESLIEIKDADNCVKYLTRAFDQHTFSPETMRRVGPGLVELFLEKDKKPEALNLIETMKSFCLRPEDLLFCQTLKKLCETHQTKTKAKPKKPQKKSGRGKKRR
ncbi:MAG: hypothetical protein LBF41_01885 [Deltaproteobacteria bacterium]|jgi:hypothetical protein|nr:hypothetical protein [Deltaproteobacteria bacterium]